MVAFSIFKLIVYAGLLVLLIYFFVYKVIVKLIERRKIRVHGEAVKATVVDYKTMKDSAGGERYYPVLQYTTRDGNLITVQSKKERYQKYKVGKELTVYYMPSEPSNFYIAGLIPYIKLAGFVLGLLGVGLLLYEMIKTVKRM
jgi:Protein of unknown function (DUF3592)